ncbi:hypothetical protein D3C72_1933750 [compost metagenome]
MDGHRRDVLQLHVADVGRHLDAELGQHVVEGLQGEGRLGGLVAGAVQAHHQAVADQLVVPHALDARQVLEALGLHGARGEQQAEGGDQSLHGRSHQNGNSGLMKNRSNQPGWLASAKAPVPE